MQTTKTTNTNFSSRRQTTKFSKQAVGRQQNLASKPSADNKNKI
jgi:hypothetical protein